MTDRYIRQMTLTEIGAPGQARLAAATVLVVGAGGLGSSVLQILAGAGVGGILIVDHDHVDISNLHRQPLYGMDDVGALKAEAARDAVLRINPDIVTTAKSERLTPANAPALIEKANIVIDAADNFAVTYMLSDSCLAAGKPLISASVVGLSGYVGAYCGGAPSYRAVFPDVPEVAGSCASIGVLGSAVAILGSLQGHLALHVLLDLKPSVLGRVVSFDGHALQFGGFGFADCPEPQHTAPFIGVADLEPEDIIVDLRGAAEAPMLPRSDALRVAPADVDLLAAADGGGRIVLCCRSGQRALRAAGRLQAMGRLNLALVALGDPS
ncbi:HesA/MoeB/ThiF family protein [Devosia elaeis]|uniref:Thiamine biosynthesis protein ThiF n=1 Tax=Devosia elaeis TaxID=1770058 RepID=A0A178I475_9HYPH|nr:HesA/MoeB/ThiF family protein [Devosia elaeis]OAM83692.1 thiamine biosynthesis protein ThiF [Devosia elaeis]